MILLPLPFMKSLTLIIPLPSGLIVSNSITVLSLQAIEKLFLVTSHIVPGSKLLLLSLGLLLYTLIENSPILKYAPGLLLNPLILLNISLFVKLKSNDSSS